MQPYGGVGPTPSIYYHGHEGLSLFQDLAIPYDITGICKAHTTQIESDNI